MKSFFLIICFIILRASGLFAFGDSMQYAVSFTPQYLFNNALKTGFEIRLSRANWIGISAEYYSGDLNNYGAYGPNAFTGINNSGLGDGIDEIRGLGLTLEDRIFFDLKKQQAGVYFKCGFYYKHLNINFSDYAYQSYLKDSATYYSLEDVQGKMDIEQYGGFGGIGYAARMFKVLRADFFFGIGDTETKWATNLDGYRNYQRSLYDFQFSGTYPVISFDLAYVF